MNGGKLRLSDYQGKYVVLHFGQAFSSRARAIPLEMLYERTRDDKHFVLIDITIGDVTPEAELFRYVAEKKLPWLQGWGGDFESDLAQSYDLNDY